MSEFAKFKDYVGDADNGLYSEEAGGFEKGLSWDECKEVNIVCEVVRAKTGRSTNKNSQNIGRPYFSVQLRVVQVNYKDTDSAVYEGALVDHFNWLPRDPEYMSAADGFNLREALGFGDAILGFQQQSIIVPEMEQLIVDDGARMKGRKVGVRVKGSQGKAKEGVAPRTFYNASWYPVDAENNPRVPVPTETVREMRAKQTAQ